MARLSVRSRAELELEVIVLRHQLTVSRCERPGSNRLSAFDRDRFQHPRARIKF